MDDPDNVDYYTVDGKRQPVHLDPAEDPEQQDLDNEEFAGADGADAAPEPVSAEDEEKAEACKSPLSKVCLYKLLLM